MNSTVVRRHGLWSGLVAALVVASLSAASFAQDFSDLGSRSDIDDEATAIVEGSTHPPDMFVPTRTSLGAPDRDRIAQGTSVVPPAPGEPTEPMAEALSDTARISALETQLRELRAQFKGGDAPRDGSRSNDGAPKPADKPAAPAPAKKTYPNVKLSGFFQFDAGWITQDADSRAEFRSLGINPQGDIQDNRGFRRARLAAQGDVAENVSFMLEMDFAQPGRPTFQDLWFDVHDVPLFGNVRVGQWRQPFGMDELTSARELTFFERPSMFAFVPFRQPGIGFHDTNKDKTVTWAASGYGLLVDIFGDGVFGDRGYGTAARLTALPVYENNGEFLIHLGGDYSYNQTNIHAVRFANGPEYFGATNGLLPGNPPGMPFFVDTGFMPASEYHLYNAELAMVCGSFHAQSELRYATVDRDNASNVTFPSFYAQAGYILTGEVRPYNKDAGVLGRIVPKRDFARCQGCGAWEVAGRYSWIDLNASDLPNVNVPGNGFTPYGGKMSNVTAGLNWYLNKYTKVQFDYIHSMLDRPPVGGSSADLYAVRAQVDF